MASKKTITKTTNKLCFLTKILCSCSAIPSYKENMVPLEEKNKKGQNKPKSLWTLPKHRIKEVP